MKHRPLERLTADTLVEAIARTPLDHHVVWSGAAFGAQTNSLRSRALALVTEVWSPVPLRLLLQRCADVAGGLGLEPNAVRSAVRSHQNARPATHFLVRRTPSGDFLALLDVPFPAIPGGRSLRTGDLVLDRHGRPLGLPDEVEEVEQLPRLRRVGRW